MPVSKACEVGFAVDVVLQEFSVHWKRACTKPIYFAFRPLPVHIRCSSFWAGAEISDQIWCKPSHFPLQASLGRVFSHKEQRG
ncbi:hypothetical protein P5673_019875 [Acropora cervicornis]|uniref:Uncharacterized protein n=1 Tax=Acropora cervicornis TaxID=6130 RepID=A0AAD9QAT0_ACRCE|nr:hypothetical protein P5673_019875 [Acropora cervicornis]